MNALIKGIKLLLRNPKAFIVALNKYRIYNWIPDNIFLKLMYKLQVGSSLDLDNPIAFNEKLQWLKLNDRKPEYSNLVDKYAVRNYVSNLIGDEYLIPLIGVWDRFNEIDFNELPNRFVLKCTHDSGSFFICKDKGNIDIKKLEKKYDEHLKRNLFWHGREWPYKNVVPRIICEKLLEDEISDYKFYCFNGIPKFFYVSKGDNTNGTLMMNFYDMDWNLCPFRRPDHEPLNFEPQRPENFDEMVELVNKLCEEFPFIRVDLFNVRGKIYFVELTFTPGSGFTPFSPPEYERIIGNWIQLPKNS